MPLSEVTPVVEDFVRDGSNEVLLLKGEWGVGKTYFWHDLIEKLSKDGEIGAEYYAYVSLFGVNNLDELKSAIFAERIRSDDVATKSSLNALQTNLKQVFNWINDASISEEIGSYAAVGTSIISRATFASVKNTLICFDDLERMGAQISSRELLGLVSMLKEQRDCKIAIIYNEGSLQEKEREAFRRHSEKLVDIELVFSQSPEEAFGCVFEESDQFCDYLKEYCLKLGIRNIRILQRIKRFSEKLAPFLERREPRTVQTVIHTLVLYVWCYYDKDQSAPSWEYLKKGIHVYLSALSPDSNLTEEEKEWNEVLQNYNYISTNDLDSSIAELIEQGYIGENDLRRELDKEDKKARSEEGERAYREAFELYYNTFANNEDIFVEELLDAFRSNMSYMTPFNLDDVVSFLRDFNRDKSADELVDEYVSHHQGTRDVLDLEGYPFRGEIQDEYVKEQFDKAAETIPEERTLPDVLRRIASESGWSKSNEKFLASCDVGQYYRYFKTEESELLRPSVKWCMNYRRLSEADKFQREIYEKAKEALQKIAAESRINRLRLSAYDIEPKNEN